MVVIVLTTITATSFEEFDNKATNDNDYLSSAALFAPCCSTDSSTNYDNKELSMICSSYPNQFPKPTRMIRTDQFDSTDIVPILQPSYGKHRNDIDNVIFAYAEGYTLPYYMMFIESLLETGYNGDVVLAIADMSIIQPHVLDYLQTYTSNSTATTATTTSTKKLNVVLYQVSLICAEQDGTTGRHVTKRGEMDVFEMCHFNDHVYGILAADGTSTVATTFPDPRDGRVVATIRYEYYWIWSLQYISSTWIMLLDARDAYFQTNPFVNLPRYNSNVEGNLQTDGYLYFFGENTEATRLGRSLKNLKWIRNGYGESILDIVRDKPTICSGSTMGEQIAIETYLRALINEHDESTTKMAGSDQGFHNYLYYSGKLQMAQTIKKIIVWEQGYGIINNLGALRIKSLREWGILRDNNNDGKYIVYQWDNVTISPVVHQYDRDNQLHKYIVKKRFKEYQKQWEEREQIQPIPS